MVNVGLIMQVIRFFFLSSILFVFFYVFLQMFAWVLGCRRLSSDVIDGVKNFTVEVVFSAKDVLYELPLLVPAVTVLLESHVRLVFDSVALIEFPPTSLL